MDEVNNFEITIDIHLLARWKKNDVHLLRIIIIMNKSLRRRAS